MANLNDLYLPILVAAGVFISPRLQSFASGGNVDVEPIARRLDRDLNTVIDWSIVRHFKPSEFIHPIDGDMLQWLSPSIVYGLDDVREVLGGRIRISPASGSMARFDGNPNSQHFTSNDRQCRAIDVMPIDNTIVELYEAAKRVPAIKGIGLYPDWKPRPGVHLDTRETTSLASWMGYKGDDNKQKYAGLDINFINRRIA